MTIRTLLNNVLGGRVTSGIAVALLLLVQIADYYCGIGVCDDATRAQVLKFGLYISSAVHFVCPKLTVGVSIKDEQPQS